MKLYAFGFGNPLLVELSLKNGELIQFEYPPVFINRINQENRPP